MSSRKGTLLERNVGRLLTLAGFSPELDKRIRGYEVDVYLKYETLKIGFECKQYERSTLAIRNLIHQWDSKNKELNFSKVVLVLVGCNISKKDRKLAQKYGITIWDGEKFDDLLDEAIEKRDEVKDKILIEAGLESTKELEDKIKKLMKDYHCRRRDAMDYLEGKLKREHLERIRHVWEKTEEEWKKTRERIEEEMKKNFFTAEEKRMMSKNRRYYGIPFRKVAGVMVKYGIKDKSKARLLCDNKGGTRKGIKYTKTRIRKMKRLMDELGFSFDKADTVTRKSKRSWLDFFRR